MLVSGSNLTVDNVIFHDAVLRHRHGVHMECMYAIGVPGFTLRNSTLPRLRDHGPVLHLRQLVEPQPPAYGNVTRREQRLRALRATTASAGWHYYGLYIAYIGPNGAADPMSNWTVRNNTFESPAFIAPDRGSDGTRWVGNLGSLGLQGRHRLPRQRGQGVLATGQGGQPGGQQPRDRRRPFGWVDPAGHDFRLKPGSPAIDAAAPGDAPALDRDGLGRDARPDAGAFEFGARRPGAARGHAPPAPGRRPRPSAAGPLRAAEPAHDLPPRLARLPSAARLRLGISREARATVRVQRLRKGRKAKPVRTLTLRRLAQDARTADPRPRAAQGALPRARDRARRGRGALADGARSSCACADARRPEADQQGADVRRQGAWSLQDAFASAGTAWGCDRAAGSSASSSTSVTIPEAARRCGERELMIVDRLAEVVPARHDDRRGARSGAPA